MRHLTPDEFVDLAERTRDASSFPHLTRCESCRAQMEDVRAMLAATAECDVPEPSPPFWDHLSARVRAAVANEPAPRARVWASRAWLPLSLAAAAALVVLAVAIFRSSPPQKTAAATVAATTTTREPLPEIDDSLTLVAALTPNLDFDSARDAGLMSGGAAEHAVTHLNDGELRELRRLLEQEMANP